MLKGFVFTISFLFVPALGAEPLSLVKAGEHCVAYKINKRLFLVTKTKVVGTSCEVSGQVIPDLDDKFHIEITFPIHTLRSGEEKRDQDVAEILGVKTNPDLMYISDTLSLKEWRAFAAKGRFTVQGKLRIGNDWHPLAAEMVLNAGQDGREIDGVARTSLKTLGIQPPKLGLGLFASVYNDLELHFHLLGNRILGFDALAGVE